MAPIIDKLQKLIAHERSARAVGSTEEAEAFAQRIASMLTEHKLSMTEVEFEAQDRDDPIGETGVEGLPARLDQWRHVLSVVVAASLYCRVVTFDEKKMTTLLWIGRGTDRTAAIEMFKYLSSLGESFAKTRVDELRSSPKAIELRQKFAHDKAARAKVTRMLRTVFSQWSEDFLLGYASALHTRLTENRGKLEAASTGTGLIVRDQQAIQSYIGNRFTVGINKPRAVKTKFDSALSEGWRTGHAVSLNARAGLGAGD